MTTHDVLCSMTSFSASLQVTQQRHSHIVTLSQRTRVFREIVAHRGRPEGLVRPRQSVQGISPIIHILCRIGWVTRLSMSESEYQRDIVPHLRKYHSPMHGKEIIDLYND